MWIWSSTWSLERSNVIDAFDITGNETSSYYWVDNEGESPYEYYYAAVTAVPHG
jgi:hypothetical protein